MSFKDYFSKQAKHYARYRPRYPEALFEHLATLTQSHQTAWDCATGSGQVALSLTPYFERVHATDASAQQIENAFVHEQIEYGVAPAERSQLPDQSMDLITVAQALHWFDRPAFFEEVRRVLKPEGALAIWFYGYFRVPDKDAALNAALRNFYDRIDPFWPPEAALIHQEYKTIEFPFQQEPTPEFCMTLDWTLDDMLGYFMTWSGTQRLLVAEGEEAIAAAFEPLQQAWDGPEQPKCIQWPLPLRVFRMD